MVYFILFLSLSLLLQAICEVLLGTDILDLASQPGPPGSLFVVTCMNKKIVITLLQLNTVVSICGQDQ